MTKGRKEPASSPNTMEAPLLADVVERNISSLLKVRQQTERRKTLQEHTADAVTRLCGSMVFVYLHALWFALWISVNLGWLGIKPFDPFPFGLLTMVVSLEAIFLSTFVLISQNRMQAASDRRADLDLQINLLAEHEVTRVIKLVDAIAHHLGVEGGRDPELDELEKDIAPEEVLEEIERREAIEEKSRQ
jgi:uncharacterized membrane protein